jgi:CRP-like cAMP-binding protein
MMIKYFSALKRVTLFKHIPEKELASLLGKIPISAKRFKKGQDILRQGDEYARLHILVSGVCYGEIVDIAGKTIKVEDFHAPSMLAPAVLFASQNTMPGSVVARVECEIAAIDKQHILRLCAFDERVLKNLLCLVSDKFVFISGKLAFFSFKTIREKLANYLLGLPEETPGYRVLTHTLEELADFFGVTRPSLSRVFTELEQAGILTKKGKKINIRDLSRLLVFE